MSILFMDSKAQNCVFVEERFLLYIHRILKLRSVCFDVVSGLH